MVIIWCLYSRKTSSLLNEVCVFRTIQKRTGEYAYVQNRNKVILGYQSLLELPFLQYPRVKQSLLHVLFLNVCSHTCSFFSLFLFYSVVPYTFNRFHQKNETAYIYKLRFSQSPVRKFIYRNYFDNHSWKHTISYSSN